MCRECIREPGWGDRVSLSRIADHFIFGIESVGMLPPKVRRGVTNRMCVLGTVNISRGFSVSGRVFFWIDECWSAYEARLSEAQHPYIDPRRWTVVPLLSKGHYCCFSSIDMLNFKPFFALY